jgi:enolase
MKIKNIELIRIFDSLGRQTVEALINNKYRASAPSGTSKSKYEGTLGLEDGLKNFESVRGSLLGDFNQEAFDKKLKENVEKLGTTITTALSMALFSSKKGIHRFPHLLGNVLGGGSHIKAKTKLNIQEILVLPMAKTMPEEVEILFNIWKEIGKSCMCLSYESAWTLDISNEDALSHVRKAADQYSAKMGIDLAASQLYSNGKYIYSNKELGREEQIDYLVNMANEYGLYYIEDPMEEDDFSGFSELKKKLSKSLICGDDLIASHMDRFRKALESNSINSVIVKPNQIGTVTDCLELIKEAKDKKMNPVVSHRSGETTDATVARLAQHAPMAKFGVAGIRTAKLNELIRLWHSSSKPKMSKIR